MQTNIIKEKIYPFLEKNKNKLFIFQLILMIAICWIHALYAGRYVEFIPINGSFQNFNPIRRLLDGQIPYQDFQDYLGMGHMVLGSIMTYFFGGDFQASLVAFSFINFVAVGSLVLLATSAVIKNRILSFSLCNGILIFLLLEPIWGENSLMGEIRFVHLLSQTLDVGNSARFIRAFIMPISCFAAIGILYYYYYKSRKVCDLIPFGVVGLLAGFSFQWSNDYGVCCWLCFLIMSFFICICRRKNALQTIICCFVELIFSFIGLFITIEVFTKGNFTNWLTSTFGTGGYQSWYYNSGKCYYFYSLEYQPFSFLQIGLVIYYLVRLYFEKGSYEAIKRYGVLAFANMACAGAVTEYRLISGGILIEVAKLFFVLNCVLEIGVAIIKKINEKTVYNCFIITLAAGIVWSSISAYKEYIFSVSDKKGVYIEELGGNNYTFGNDLIETQAFLDGQNYFSTYASAQEAISGTYQPSGTDYIIHVMGDKQREEYLDSFHNDDFKYVATIREEYSDWEYWVRRANWFFYRDLLAEWHPVYESKYELFWGKNDGTENNIIEKGFTVYTETPKDNSIRLVIQCEEKIDGIADVYIDYSVENDKSWKTYFSIRRLLGVENTGFTNADDKSFDTNFLRESSKEYIPIIVVNGYGEVTLSANPWNNASVILNDYKVERIFTVTDDYIKIKRIVGKGDVLVFDNTKKNRGIIMDANKVKFNGIEGEIKEIKKIRDNIYVYVDQTYEILDKNIVEVS